jgi:hypothetical protein
MEPEIPLSLWPAIRETPFVSDDHHDTLRRIHRAHGPARTVGAVSLATQIRLFNFSRAMDFGGDTYDAAKANPVWYAEEGQRIFEAMGGMLLSPEEAVALVVRDQK